MSYTYKCRVALATAADGSVTGYTPVVSGLIDSIRYVKTDFDDGVSFAVTLEDTDVAVWSEAAVNASATRAPRQATHSTAGAAALYAAAGQAVLEKIPVANERIKIVVAGGGNVKSGDVYITLS